MDAEGDRLPGDHVASDVRLPLHADGGVPRLLAPRRRVSTAPGGGGHGWVGGLRESDQLPRHDLPRERCT